MLFAILVIRLYRAGLDFWRSWRRKQFQPWVDSLIISTGTLPLKAAPVFPGDRDVIEELLVLNFRVVTGPVKEQAVEEAEKLGLVERRIIQLGGKNIQTVAYAIAQLGKLGSKRAVDALIVILRSGPAETRTPAAKALGRIGDIRAAVPLIEALDSAQGWVGNPVEQAIIDLGESAIPALLHSLDSDTPGRAKAVEVLGRIGAISAAPRMRELLAQGSDPLLCVKAAEALGRLKDPEASLSLRQGLHSPSREVRVESARAMGRIGDPSACGDLEDSLNDRYWWVQLRAAEALSKLGEQGREILKKNSSHPDPGISSLSSEMLNISRSGAKACWRL